MNSIFSTVLTCVFCVLVNTLAIVSPVQAQDWLTRDACDISTINSDDPVLKAQLEEVSLIKAEEPLENDLGKLWKIQLKSGQIGYLWGSMHASNGFILDLPEALVDIIKSTEVAYFEQTFDGMSRDELADFLLRDIWNNPLTADHWLQKINPNVKSAVVDRFRFFGIKPTKLSSLKATAAAQYLLADPCEDFNLNRYPIQDVYIEMLASHNGAEIRGLENLGALSDAAYGFWNNKLPVSIINIYGTYLVDPKLHSSEIAMNRRIATELYRQGEIGKIMSRDRQYVLKVLGSEDGEAHLERALNYLLVQRNKNFIKRFLPSLARQKLLIVVGAAHLPGKNGLIEILRRREVSVERVVLPGESL